LKALKVSEVAQELQVDRDTVYRLIKSGKLKAFKVGSDWRITEKALEEFIRKNTFSAPSCGAVDRMSGRAKKQGPSRGKVNWAKRIEEIFWKGKEAESWVNEIESKAREGKL
jgi:excisionase family DNA binding protein